jgi:hypothetical protein
VAVETEETFGATFFLQNITNAIAMNEMHENENDHFDRFMGSVRKTLPIDPKYSRGMNRVKITPDQQKALDGICPGSVRAIVGAAGTGKTLVLQEKIRSVVEGWFASGDSTNATNEKILLVCCSRGLCLHLRRSLPDVLHQAILDVFHRRGKDPSRMVEARKMLEENVVISTFDSLVGGKCKEQHENAASPVADERSMTAEDRPSPGEFLGAYRELLKIFEGFGNAMKEKEKGNDRKVTDGEAEPAASRHISAFHSSDSDRPPTTESISASSVVKALSFILEPIQVRGDGEGLLLGGKTGSRNREGQVKKNPEKFADPELKDLVDMAKGAVDTGYFTPERFQSLVKCAGTIMNAIPKSHPLKQSWGPGIDFVEEIVKREHRPREARKEDVERLLGTVGSVAPAFRHVFVDEAEDLFLRYGDAWLEVLSAYRDEPENGCFCFTFDPMYHDLRIPKESPFDAILRGGAKLKAVVRNPKSIYGHWKALLKSIWENDPGHFPVDPELYDAMEIRVGHEFLGPDVQWLSVDRPDRDSVAKKIRDTFRDVFAGHRDVTVAVLYQNEKLFAKYGGEKLLTELGGRRAADSKTGDDDVIVDTAAAFKGLEAHVVFLITSSGVSSWYMEPSIYLGRTRSTCYLFLVELFSKNVAGAFPVASDPSVLGESLSSVQSMLREGLSEEEENRFAREFIDENIGDEDFWRNVQVPDLD